MHKKTPVHFIDLDGTLYDDRWRLPLVDSGSKDPWARYHEAADRDEGTNPFVEQLVRKLIEDESPFYFLTARPSTYRHSTLKKLRTIFKSLNSDQLIIREDFSAETASWKWWKIKVVIDTFLKSQNPYPVVVDNDPSVISLAKEKGAQTILVQHWEGEAHFEAKTIEFFADIMRIHSDRHATYGQNYLRFGPVMKALMPERVVLETEEDWTRIALFIHILNKLTRYSSRYNQGGHPDSLDDMAVYSLLLKEVDDTRTPEEGR